MNTLAIPRSFLYPFPNLMCNVAADSGRKTSHRFLISGHLDPSADLRRGATKERERYSGTAVGAAVDMELASEAAYTFASFQKAKSLIFLNASRAQPSLDVTR